MSNGICPKSLIFVHFIGNLRDRLRTENVKKDGGR